MEITKNITHGFGVASYDVILWYIGKNLDTNSGSVVGIKSDNGHFKRAFFSFAASLHSFMHGCRPLLFVDGTHLFEKYGERC